MEPILDALATVCISGLLGVATWSFAEYALHDWVGHLGKGKNEFSREHLKHHTDTTYFTPTPKKALAAVPVLGTVGVLAWMVVGPLAGLPFTLGLAAMYVAYEVAHRRSHTHPPRGAYSMWIRKSHLYHHFKNPNRNHGVTSPIWDIVFRTYDRPGRVRVPRKHAPVWLVDEHGEIKPEYVDDFELAGRKPAAKAA